MKITAIDTVRLDEFPNLLWVQVRTDAGLTGLGETFFNPGPVEAHIHEYIAPRLIGQDPCLVDRHSRALVGYVGFSSSGAETRGNSAIDIALWDLFGQATKLPIHALLGGQAREAIRVYNTCAGYRYIRSTVGQSTTNFGIGDGRSEGPYEDLDGFLTRADELAESLLAMDIRGMKIWPFDTAAEAHGGHTIALDDLKRALDPFEKIRARVGDKIDIMCELHGLWDVPSAKRICQALEPYRPLWVEDPVKLHNLDDLAALASSTRLPIAAGEALTGLPTFRHMLERKAAGMPILDIAWVGGITEARKIAALAEAFNLPVAAHDCTGPVVLTASTHLATHLGNCFIQEVVRAFYFGWYRELLTELPPLAGGLIRPPQGPGLGTALKPEVLTRKDARIRRSGG
jgi:galactonate dehydratase